MQRSIRLNTYLQEITAASFDIVRSTLPYSFRRQSMYDFSGIVFRLWGVCGIMFLLGVTCLLLSKPWKTGYRFKDGKIGWMNIVCSIGLAIVLATRMLYPDVSTHTGAFLYSHRNSRVAPPLPFTEEYVFENPGERHKCFYLDVFSKKKIFPQDFECGVVYTVYYDKLTRVIVKAETYD
jgi:hypothetical protein